MVAAKQLLATCCIEQLNRGENDGRPETADGLLYEKGRVCDFFLLMLEGRLEVKAGAEQFHIELGPWKSVGSAALLKEDYVADFNACVVSETARFLKITRSDYRRALEGVFTHGGHLVASHPIPVQARQPSEEVLRGSVPGSHLTPPSLAPQQDPPDPVPPHSEAVTIGVQPDADPANITVVVPTPPAEHI